MVKYINMNKKIIKNIIITIIIISLLLSCRKSEKINNEKETLYVYNWGLYIDEECIDLFEKKYNVNVVYDMFDTNEEMFAVVEKEARVYDVICPTDYMIEKMIRKNMLMEVDFTKLDNYKYVDKNVLNIMKSFDKNNTYSVPYVYSTIGLICNDTMLNNKNLDRPESWADLWDEKYTQDILMQEAMRDLLMVGLKKNNYSMNTKNKNEIDKATNDLINQKPLVQAYVIDQVRDKMVQQEASIGVTYSGEVIYIKEETKNNNQKFTYVLPKEGTNLTIDAWVIPKNAKNADLAKKWIDFMCEPEIALKNFDVMHYGLPNTGAKQYIDEKYLNDEAVFPDLSNPDEYELYKDLGEYEEIYNNAFKKIKS